MKIALQVYSAGEKIFVSTVSWNTMYKNNIWIIFIFPSSADNRCKMYVQIIQIFMQESRVDTNVFYLLNIESWLNFLYCFKIFFAINLGPRLFVFLLYIIQFSTLFQIIKSYWTVTKQPNAKSSSFQAAFCRKITAAWILKF